MHLGLQGLEDEGTSPEKPLHGYCALRAAAAISIKMDCSLSLCG